MRILISTLTILLGSWLGCQASLYRTYQTENGLSHNSVWAVMQDSRGFLWFGTNDGLNRFDGLNCRVFRRIDGDTLSLGSNFIHCLLEPQPGRILVGTKEGLYCYDTNTDKFSHIILGGQKFGHDKTSVHCLLADEAGNIWVGCYGQGIYKLSSGFKQLSHYGPSQLPSPFVTALSMDAGGNLWIGTDNAGLYRLSSSSGKVSRTQLDKTNVQSLFRQNNNSLWVGTAADGLFCLNPLTGEASQILIRDTGKPVRDIKAITPYGPGEIIMGSEYGLLKYDSAKGTLDFFEDGNTFDNLPDKSIFAITVDDEGGLWLGTYFYGVSYRSPRINAFTFYPVSKTGNAAYSYNILHQLAAGADGNVLLTSRNNGISLFNPATGVIRDMQLSLPSSDIHTVLVVDNQIWASTYGRGISVMNYPSGVLMKNYTSSDGLPSNTVNELYRSSDGKIYVGTSRGAAVLQDGKFQQIKPIGNASVMTILEDLDGNLWFATHFHGIFKLTPEGKAYNYNNRPGDNSTIPGNNVNNIFLDSRGKIWVGTEGEGLAIFNPASGKVEKRLSEADGLPSNTIYATLEDEEGNLWTTTGGGLIKIDGETHAFRNFRYLENLLKIHYSHNSALAMGADSRIYLGGSGGFLTFNPSEITRNTAAPKVLITEYNIDGKPNMISSTGDSKIEMKASESTLGIDVACLSYLSPEQNVIAYRLQGYDEDWKYLTDGKRHIEYMNLPWGSYTFEVKGANNDGEWSQPVEMGVTVHRPLLMSNWMLFVYLLLLILAGYIIKLRIAAVQRRKMMKFSHAKEKELYEAKIGFFTNIAHEIRTPLSLISAPLESILSSGDGNDKTRRNLTVMQSNVRRLLELINQLLDFRKMEAQLMRLNFHKANVSELIMEICRRYEEFAKLHGVKLDTQGVDQNISCVLDSEAFKKIIGNLMSNAMKYADKHISVSMHDDLQAGVLRLEVVDDGPGIKEKDMEKIFESFYRVDDHGKHPGSGLGLPLARSLAQMHSGSLTVESEYGHGSKFILEIPTSLEEGSEISGDDHQHTDGTEKEEVVISAKSEPERPTLLIVEDNEELRTFISDNLSDFYHVSTASNGIEAIEVLQRELVDIVVSDIMMPDMDGIELCRAVRNNPEFSHVPIVILSAKTDVETKVEGLNIGADAYIEKPFSMEQLKAQVKSILDSRRRLQESLIKSPLEYYRQHHSDDEKEAEKAAFIQKLNSLILDNLTNPDFSIDSLAQEFYMSRSSFHKRIKGITGETPNDYIRIVRLSKSAELLSSGKYQIVEVCYMVGFNTPSYFSKCFSKHFGMLPKDYIHELNKT